MAKFYLQIVRLNRRDENKEKDAKNGPSLKKNNTSGFIILTTDLANAASKAAVSLKAFLNKVSMN